MENTYICPSNFENGFVAQLDTCLPAGREHRKSGKRVKKFFVYVLVSKTRGLRFYVGMSESVDNRVKEHNSGKTKSTKGYRPWELFFFEECNSRIEAREREKYYKSGSGKESIKQKWFRSSTG